MFIDYMRVHECGKKKKLEIVKQIALNVKQSHDNVTEEQEENLDFDV